MSSCPEVTQSQRTQVHQHDSGRRRNGPNLPWWFSTTVWANPDGELHLGEATVLLRFTINVDGRGKPREWVEDHSIGQPDVVHGGRLAPWA